MKVSAETRGDSSKKAEPDSLEALLVETGVAALTASSKATVQEAALQALSAAAIDLTPLRRALLRDLAVQALKRGGFESPARLVDVALPRSAGSETTTGPGSDVLVDSPQPWPEQVDGCALLAD